MCVCAACASTGVDLRRAHRPPAPCRRLKKQEEIEKSFLKLAKKGVSKGAKPDHLRVSPLPRNFKGVVKLPDLKEEWGKQFASKKATAG